MKLDDLPPRHRAEALSQIRKIEKVPHVVPAPKLSPTIPELDAKDESLAANQGKREGAGRVKVSIIRRSTKLLDKDNLYGSVKFLCDALRHEGVIRNDDPESIDLVVTQEKCARRSEAGTEITIEASHESPI